MAIKPFLRLFKIEHAKFNTQYFDNKRLAKRERVRLSAEFDGLTVARGPDHWKGETGNV